MKRIDNDIIVRLCDFWKKLQLGAIKNCCTKDEVFP